MKAIELIRLNQGGDSGVYNRFGSRNHFAQMSLVTKIVSGGQSGADIAALDFAIQHSIAHGGWCPRGRRAENGPIGTRYRLRETPSAGYLQRTLWNVRNSDGTVIFTTDDKFKGGSKKTAQFAHKLGKPWLRLAAKRPGVDHAAVLRCFIKQHAVKTLNVAGPRKSQEPAVGKFVTRTLCAALMGRMSAKRTLRVLVVDDEPVVRDFCQSLLPGFRVIQVGTGEQALRFAKRYKLNLVVTDFTHPGRLDGLRFMRLFKKVQPTTPVIMASGNDIRGLRRRAFRVGAHAFLAKPFRAAAFRAAVDYALCHPMWKREVRHSRG